MDGEKCIRKQKGHDQRDCTGYATRAEDSHDEALVVLAPSSSFVALLFPLCTANSESSMLRFTGAQVRIEGLRDSSWSRRTVGSRMSRH